MYNYRMDVKAFRIKKIISMTLKLLAVFFAIFGTVYSIVLTERTVNGETVLMYMSGARTFLYFTIDANVLTALLFLFGVFFDVKDLVKGRYAVRKTYTIFKHLSAHAMFLTFLSFYAMIIGGAILYGNDPGTDFFTFALLPSNWTVHMASPFLAVLDYLFFNMSIEKEKRLKVSAYSLIFPGIYALLIYVLSIFFNVRFSEDGSVAPYFFLNYTDFQWYVLVVIDLAIAVGFFFLNIFLFFLNGKLTRIKES